MKIINSRNQNVVATNCDLANTFWKRTVGLIGRKNFDLGDGLYITKCNAIHMFFMTRSIDVVFLDKNRTVVHTIRGIRPWRMSRIVSDSQDVLELPQGSIVKHFISIGDTLELINE